MTTRQRSEVSAAPTASLLSPVGKTEPAAFQGSLGRPGFANNRATDKGVYNPTGGFEIFAVYPEGTNAVQLINSEVVVTGLASPADGTRVAFTRVSSRGDDPNNSTEIFAIHADGTLQTNLSRKSTDDSEPAWSHGRQTAFRFRFGMNAVDGDISGRQPACTVIAGKVSSVVPAATDSWRGRQDLADGGEGTDTCPAEKKKKKNKEFSAKTSSR